MIGQEEEDILLQLLLTSGHKLDLMEIYSCE